MRPPRNWPHSESNEQTCSLATCYGEINSCFAQVAASNFPVLSSYNYCNKSMHCLTGIITYFLLPKTPHNEQFTLMKHMARALFIFPCIQTIRASKKCLCVLFAYKDLSTLHKIYKSKPLWHCSYCIADNSFQHQGSCC